MNPQLGQLFEHVCYSRQYLFRLEGLTKKTADNTASMQLPANRTAKIYALPTPSAHHRHRGIPVHHRKEEVERLEGPPVLHEAPKTTFTNSMTSSQLLTERIGKAWSYNRGPGPVWELLEDRSWYKESASSSDDSRKESSRRPRVYENLSIQPGWEVLDYQYVIHVLHRNWMCQSVLGMPSHICHRMS